MPSMEPPPPKSWTCPGCNRAYHVPPKACVCEPDPRGPPSSTFYLTQTEGVRTDEGLGTLEIDGHPLSFEQMRQTLYELLRTGAIRECQDPDMVSLTLVGSYERVDRVESTFLLAEVFHEPGVETLGTDSLNSLPLTATEYDRTLNALAPPQTAGDCCAFLWEAAVHEIYQLPTRHLPTRHLPTRHLPRLFRMPGSGTSRRDEPVPTHRTTGP
jgi:hypothetical protein